MAIEVYSPAGSTTGGPAAKLAAPVDARRPLRLALVANGKPNSAELLDAVADRLKQRIPIEAVRRYRKPSVSVAPVAADVAEIAEWASATLNAVGD